jgi:hypothetical protein
VDHICDPLNFVASGINQRLHIWRGRSYSAGHRHRRNIDPDFSGSKTIVAVWTLFGGGKVFGKEVVGRFSCRSRRPLSRGLL